MSATKLPEKFELIEWRMTQKYCPITVENELSIVSIIRGEKIWVIRAQCKASCKHGKKPRHSSTQESLGSCTGPVQEFGNDAFMMWMAGSIVHLFSIGITFFVLWQPISTLHGVGKGLCVQQAKSFHSYELLGPLYVHNSLPTWHFFWLQNTIWRRIIFLFSLSLSFSLYERCLSFFRSAPSGIDIFSSGAIKSATDFQVYNEDFIYRLQVNPTIPKYK